MTQPELQGCRITPATRAFRAGCLPPLRRDTLNVRTDSRPRHRHLLLNTDRCNSRSRRGRDNRTPRGHTDPSFPSSHLPSSARIKSGGGAADLARQTGRVTAAAGHFRLGRGVTMRAAILIIFRDDTIATRVGAPVLFSHVCHFNASFLSRVSRKMGWTCQKPDREGGLACNDQPSLTVGLLTRLFPHYPIANHSALPSGSRCRRNQSAASRATSSSAPGSSKR